MMAHIYKNKFYATTVFEYNQLYEKGTFLKVEKSNKQTIPII
jgi:hypothetical protein